MNNLPEKVFEVSPDPIVLITSEADIINCNKAGNELLGWEPENSGKSLFELDESLSRKDWKEIWSNLQRSHSHMIETTIQDKNGIQIPVQLIFSLIFPHDSSAACVFIRDISQKRHLEQRIREANIILDY